MLDQRSGAVDQRPVPSLGTPGPRACGGGAAAAGRANTAVISDPYGPEVTRRWSAAVCTSHRPWPCSTGQGTAPGVPRACPPVPSGARHTDTKVPMMTPTGLRVARRAG